MGVFPCTESRIQCEAITRKYVSIPHEQKQEFQFSDLYFLFSEPQEYCQFEHFNVSCPEGSLLLMTKARYGRMKVGKCVRGDYGYIGCAADVLGLFTPHMRPFIFHSNQIFSASAEGTLLS